MIKQFISKCDFICPNITLYYRGEDKHSSMSSGLISIFLIITIIFFLVYLSLDFITRKKPSAYYYQTYIDDIGVHYLNSSSIFHFILLNFNQLYDYQIDNRYFEIIGTTIFDGNYLNIRNSSQIDHYIYGPCDNNDIKGIEKSLKDDYLIYFRTSFCIKKFYNKTLNKIININDSDFIYPSLQHGASKMNNQPYNIYIQKCQNNTVINNNSCYSSDYELKDIYNGLYYACIFLNKLVDVNNYKHPISDQFHKVSNLFNKETYTANHLNFNPLKLITDSGILFEREHSLNSYLYYYNEKLVVQDKKEILGSFHFWIQNQQSVYVRNYKKIQDISGSVDGIIEIIMIFIKFINFLFFSEYQIIHDFNEEIDKQISKKLKKNTTLNKPIILKLNNQFSNIYELNNYKNFDKFNSKNTFNSMNIKNNNFINDESNTPAFFKKIDTELEHKFRKIGWCEALCGLKFKYKQSEYINFIKNQREKIISEEMIIKFYINITKTKQFILLNDKNNNKIIGKNKMINNIKI